MVRTSRALVYGGMFFLPLLSIRVGSSLSVSDAVFAAAAVVLAISLRAPAKAPPASAWMMGSFMILIGGLMATFRALSVSSSLQVVFNGVYVLFIWQWVARQVLDTRRRLRLAIDCFIAGASISAVVGIIQTKFHTLGYDVVGGRAIGLARQPDIAAVTYALSLVFALGLVMECGRGRWAHRFVAIGAVTVALILSASVSGMAAALLGCAVLLVRRGIKPRTLVGVAVVIAGLYVTATALEGPGAHKLNPIARIQETTGFNTGQNTVNPRTETIRNAWSEILENPVVGRGLDQGSGLVYFDPDVRVSYPTHDFPLLIWFQGGILFLVGAAIAMATAARRVIGRRRDPIGDALFAGTIAVLLFSLQSPAMFDRWLWLPFVLALAYRPGRAHGDIARSFGPRPVAAHAVIDGNGNGAVPVMGNGHHLLVGPPRKRRAFSFTTSATGSTRRMLLLTIVDQGASSVSNFVLAVLVAHYSGARELGIFALLISTYVLSQGIVRSLTSDCLLTRSGLTRHDRLRYERGGYLAALVLSSCVSVGVLGVTTMMHSDFAVPFTIFALFFPLMALQDFSRYIGIRRQDPGYAIRLDVAWLVLFLAAYAILRSEHLLSMPWLFGAWSGTGAAVGLTTLSSQFSPRMGPLLRFWWGRERAVGLRFAGQFTISSVSTYVIFYLLVLFVVSVSTVGTIKLALLALGPVTVMASGVQSALVTVAARRFPHDRSATMRFLLAVGLATACATALWTTVVYAIPPHVARALLGRTWPHARGLLLFAGLGFVLAGLSGAAVAGLRAMRAARENLRLAIVLLPFVLVLDEGGAALFGAQGFVIGASLAAAIYAALAWWVVVRTAKARDAGVTTATPTTRVLVADQPAHAITVVTADTF